MIKSPLVRAWLVWCVALLGSALAYGQTSVQDASGNLDDLTDFREQVLKDNITDIDPIVTRPPTDWFPIQRDTLPALLKAIDVRGGEVLTDAMADELQSRISKLLVAYKEGNVDQLIAERFCATADVPPDVQTRHLAIIQTMATAQHLPVPTDAADRVRFIAANRFRREEKSGYENLYNEISPGGSHIQIKRVEAIRPPMREHLKLQLQSGVKRSQNGWAAVRSSLSYQHRPEQVLLGSGTITYADAWIAASDSEGHKYSRFHRYYWSPDDLKWLPAELVVFYTRPRKADPFF